MNDPGLVSALREMADLLEDIHSRGSTYRERPSLSGEPEDPVGTLVVTILSQASNDVQTARVYSSLIEAFPIWGSLACADPDEVEELLRPGGLAVQKRRYVQESLRRIHCDMGDYVLDPLKNWSDEKCYSYLTGLPGVGLKTAACVLLFGLDRDVFPVDTHVARICRRVGLVPEKASPDQVHRQLEPSLPAGVALGLHLNLLEHGRTICKASRPNCGECGISHLCASAP